MGHLIDLIQDNFHDHWDATILPLTHGRQGGNGLSLLKFWPYVYLQHSLQVHRLIVVDEGQKMYGVVSLSDILNFLVLKPFGKRACVCVCTTIWSDIGVFTMKMILVNQNQYCFLLFFWAPHFVSIWYIFCKKNI